MRWLGLFCGAAICTGICGCHINVGDSSGRQEVGSGTVRSEKRAVSGFDAITLNGLGKIVIKQDGNESLTVSAEDNLLPLLKTEVTNGKLQLDIEQGVKLQPTKPIEFRSRPRS
jgi:hypothetical protein